MKNILISSYDLQVGGVERSLISLLENIDLKTYNIELLLQQHIGEFFKYLPSNIKLLPEIKEYSIIRKPLKEIFDDRKYIYCAIRIFSKLKANIIKIIKGYDSIENMQLQYMIKYSNKYVPILKKEYDIAISYLWPHHFVANKVKAKKKIAWIHTDFSNIKIDSKEDLSIWSKFDIIVAVSEECKNSFLDEYPQLSNRIKVIENINSVNFIREMAKDKVETKFTDDKFFKVVSVARLSYAKGIDNSVKALRILHDRGFKDIKWYVIGYGPDENKIKKIIKQYELEDSFILLGKKINPYPYVKASNLYVQPSRYEGKAVTVTEAKILGKPIVITNYSTAKSQIINGLDGYITELSIEGIANGIEKLYKNRELREELIGNCCNMDYSNINELDKLYKLF